MIAVATEVREKVCTGCGVSKPLDAFTPQKRGKYGRRSQCRACYQAKISPEKRRQYHQTYKMKHPDRVKTAARRRTLKRYYDLTPQQYHDLLATQGGKCAMCGTTEPGKEHFPVDHNHRTGAVRALLCDRCNRLLGHADDDVVLLANAIEFLKKYGGGIR